MAAAKKSVTQETGQGAKGATLEFSKDQELRALREMLLIRRFEEKAGQLYGMDKNLIPGCTYCQPQIASVGLTEAKAKEGGREIRVGRFPFAGNGKAIALGEDQGLIKVIFDKKTGQLLGAHMTNFR